MIKLIFVTGNSKKFQSAQEILKKYGICLVQKKIETIEIQDCDVRRIAEFSAKYAGDLLKKPVIKVDVGFEIEALNNFPGPLVKYINEWLPSQKILKLMEGENNRKAKFVEVIAYYEPGISPLSFVAETQGEIAQKPAGEKSGWGIDAIFIPRGFRTSLATLSNKQRLKVWSKSHWIRLAQYLRSKNKNA